jgi:hypothetical protein
MDLTKRETQVLVLAIGTAIQKEKAALDGLKIEIPELGIRQAIAERSRNIADLDRIRKRLTSRN